MKRLLAIAVLTVFMLTLAAVPLAAAQDTPEEQNETIDEPQNVTDENVTDENVTEEEDVEALELAENETENITTVILTSAVNYPDALVASSAAEKTGSPLLIAGDEPVEDVAADEEDPEEMPEENVTEEPDDTEAEENGNGLFDGLMNNDEQDDADAPTGMQMLGVAQDEEQEQINEFGQEEAPADEELVGQEEMPEEDVEAEEAVQELDEDTQQMLEQIDPDEIVVIGGPQVIGANMTDDLEENYTVTRLWGYTEYGTSAEVANYFWPEGTDSAMLVQHELQDIDFRTLGGASELAEHEQMPIYLMPEDNVPAQSLVSMHHLDVQDATFVGTNMTEELEEDLDETGVAIEDEISGNDTAELQNELWDRQMDLLDETDHAVIVASDDYHHALAAASDPAMVAFYLTDEMDEMMAEEEVEAEEAEEADEEAVDEEDENGILGLGDDEETNETMNETDENQTAEDDENGLLNQALAQENDYDEMEDTNETVNNETETEHNVTEEELADENDENETVNNETEEGEVLPLEEEEAEEAEENVTADMDDRMDELVEQMNETGIENASVVGTEELGQDVADQLEEADVGVTTFLGPVEDVTRLNHEFVQEHILRFQDLSVLAMEEREDLLEEREEELGQRTATLIVLTERMIGEDAPQDAQQSLEEAATRLEQGQYEESHQVVMEARDEIRTAQFDQTVDTEDYDAAVDAEVWSVQQFQQHFEEMNEEFASEFEDEPMDVQLWIIASSKYLTEDQQQQLLDQSLELWEEDEELLPAFEQARQQVMTAEEPPVEEEEAEEPSPVANETMQNETVNNETDMGDIDDAPANETGNETFGQDNGAYAED